jgi:glycolate oxidase iron-sulfur subunit
LQTHFTLSQLADAGTAEAESILRRCVHCGFCNATCPTYQLTGDELDGPRGRIYLIKHMLEGSQDATATVVRHLDRCLSCLSCQTTCPSGVAYGQLIDHARRHVARTWRRPPGERALRGLLRHVLPHRGRFRLALRAAALVQPLKGLLPGSLRTLIDQVPTNPAVHSDIDTTAAQVFPAIGPRRLRVGLQVGCVQPVLNPGIDAAAVRLLNRLGVEVVTLGGRRCCGALTHHLGEDAAPQFAAAVQAWTEERQRNGLDALVSTASGCGAMAKEYGHVLRHHPRLAEPAAALSAITRDISEIVLQLGLPAGTAPPRPLRVAWHAACALQHAQRVTAPPKDLLHAAGFTLLEIAEPHLCCGSAGTYNLLQPELAGQLRQRKLAAIAAVHPDVAAMGNIGCLTQLSRGNVPVLHLVELLDWATGGPEPTALAGVATRPLKATS